MQKSFNTFWLWAALASVLGTVEMQSALRIMPMGDSITQGDQFRNSYRRSLWQMLTNAGLNVDFVGTFTNNVNGAPPNPDFDRNHQSVAGYKVEDLLFFMDTWLAENTPDYVLLHIGTNDRLAGQSIASTTNEIGQIIDRLRISNPNVQVILAKIIPYTIAYSGGDSIPALNTAIGELALAKTTPLSRVVAVDQFTGYNASTDNYDGLHPNATGELKLATNWFNTLSALIGTSSNVPPVAELLDPFNGQTFLAPTTIKLDARVFDIDGAITNVSFYINGSKVDETNAPPYSYFWTNPPLGIYTNWVVAQDNGGIAVTSAVSVAYVNPVPAYFRAMNLNGAAVTIEGKPWISGASALGSGLAAAAGGTFTATYGFPLIPAPDTNTYAMLASGWVRAGVTSGQGLNITQTVTNGFYHVWIHTMENNESRYRNMNVMLEGNQVATNIGDLNLGEWRAYGPYLALVNDGILNIDVLRSTKGEPVVCGLVLAQATFPPVVSNAPPTISSLANLTIDEDTTTGPLAVSVGDPDNSPEELLLSSAVSNSSLFPPGSVVVGGSGSNRTVTLTPAVNANGSSVVSIFVSDPYGSIATNSFEITVTSLEDSPTVSITAPMNLALHPPGDPIPVNVSANDPEGLIVSVELLADGNPLTNWTTAPFSYTWTNASLGFHELVAVVTDGAGLMATSAIVNVQVAVPPPYYRGISLAGPATTVEGQGWLSDFDAKAQGFSITNGTSTFSSYGFTPTPTPDAGTLNMLQGRYYRLDPPNGQGINMAQTIVNGAYEVYLWVLEDFVSNQRSMNVFLEGTQVATNIGDLPKEQWAKYGPYPVVVSDGLLNIDVVRSFKGDPLIMGLLIQSALPPEENTTPQISGLVDQSTPEDTLLGPLPFTISDLESAPNLLALSAVSGNPTLLPVTNIVFGGTGTNRTVTVLPGTNQTGTAAISVIVSDPYGASATNTFNVTVTPINDAPTVAIVSPVNLSTYNPPANVPVSISATDVDDVVATVQVFGDGLPLVTFTNAPYSLTWSNLALGAHTLVAVATDTLGASATSAVVTVTFTTEPAYFRGINLAGSAVTVEGRQWLSDSAARADGMTVTNATLGNGPYPFSIVPAVDADTQTMLQGRYYTLNPPPGQGFYIGQTLPNGNYEVFLWALEDLSDNFRAMNIFLEGVQVATNIGDLPRGSWAKYGPYPVTVTDGQLNLSAVKGSKGDPLLNGILIQTAVPPNSAPFVTLASPTNSAIFDADESIVVTADAGDVDGNLATVALLANGSPLVTFSNAPYSFTWTNAPLGAQLLTAVATDSLGASATSAVVSVLVTNLNTPPIATNQFFTMIEGGVLPVLLNAADEDSTNFAFTIVTNPVNGTLIDFNPTNGTLTYLPAADFAGADSFAFEVSDGELVSGVAVVSVMVTNVNDVPVALSQVAVVNAGTNAASFLPLGNLGEVIAAEFDSAASGAAPGAAAGYVKNADGTYGAFRWTATNGVTLLGDLPGGPTNSYALGMNADGVVVGVGNSGTPEAFRWEVGIMTGLGFLPGGNRSEAVDVNADGMVVVGGSESAAAGPFGEAFRWTTNGMTALGFLSGGNNSGATGVSADGEVVVGWSDATGFLTEAFVWTTNGMIGLGDLPGGLAWSDARGVSADGLVVVGYGNSTNGQEAFRWTTNGMVGLGDLPGGIFNSVALAANADGSVIVGAGDTDRGTEAFYWNARFGMVNLSELLAGLGQTNFANWTLQEARSISPDGRTIAGVGVNPTGGREAWVVTLPSVDDLQLPAENQPLNVTLTAWDPDGPSQAFLVVTNPAHGQLSGLEPNLIYTPNTNFTGTDQFSFTVSDGIVTSGVATVFITVTNVAAAPLITLDQPVDGAAFAVGASVNLAATATDADNDLASVTFLTNGTPLVFITNGPFAFAWTNAPVGVHQIRAIATDLTGLSATSAVAMISITNSAPTVAIIAPTNGAAFNIGLTVPVSITAADAESNLATVKLLANGLELTVFSNAPFDFNWTNAPVGTHLLTAVATDALGLATTSSVVTIHVINTAPTVAVTAPADQAVFAQGTLVSITATAGDTEGNLATVQLLANGLELTLLSNAPFAFDWTNAPAGTHQLSAVATDALGLATTSSVVTIYVTNQAPTVAITSPTNNTLVVFGNPVLLTATAADVDGSIANVKFYSGETLLGEGAGLDYQFLWTNAPLGNATLTAVATDNFGLATTSAPVTLGIVLVPQLTIVNDLDGNALLTLTGETNRTYLITASTNVTDWLPVHTNATTNGTFNWTDTASAPETKRFYRAQPALP